MVNPSSPSVAVAQAMAAHRGKRTGILLGDKGAILVENGMEDIDEFWQATRSPPDDTAENPADEEDQSKQQRLKPKNTSKPKAKPRFSLDGQAPGEDDDDNAATKAKHIMSRLDKKGNTTWSPSDMSRVSTAPPTPASMVTQHEEDLVVSPPEEQIPYSPPEGVRASPEEDEEEAVLPQASGKSPTVDTLPIASDELDEDTFPLDDDDDMVPPPPPDEEADLSIQGDDEPEKQNDVEFPDDVDDDNDDDKEGDGFAMVHDPETPESVRTERLEQEARERKKKAKRKKKDTSSTAETPARSTKTKRSKKKVTYMSPMGYPAGNREYEAIPVSDFKDTPEENNLRRSKRARIKPLAFWKNEREVYEPHNEEGVLGEAMGHMPVVTRVISAQPTPYKKRKVSAVASKATNKKAAKAGKEEIDESPLDTRKLRKVSASDLMFRFFSFPFMSFLTHV